MLLRNFTDADATAYRAAQPFPHIVVDGLWDDEILEAARNEVLGIREWSGEKKFYGAIGKRWLDQWDKLPPTVRKIITFASEPSFLRQLEAVAGEPGLIPDPYLKGGGIHSIGTGGFLKMHADFNWHEEMRLYRRLNLLVYLNRDWNEAWGGDLQLGTKRADGTVEIASSHFPHFNRTILFTTDDHSMHGHPDPLACPGDVRRNSIALYYYIAAKPEGTSARTNTAYRSRIGEAPIALAKLRDKVASIFG